MRVKILLNMNISWKIGSLLSLMVVLTVASFFVVGHYQDLLGRDTEVINIAGRQRMLTQRIALLSEMTYSNVEGAVKDLSEAIDIYQLSHKALQEGGSVPGFEGIVLAKNSKENVSNVILIVSKKWEVYRDKAELIADHAANENTQNALNALEYIRDQNQDMLRANINLVNELVNVSNENQKGLSVVLLIIVFSNFLVAIFALWVSKEYIVSPLKRIAERANSVAYGELSNDPFDFGSDEVGYLNSSMNKIINNFQKTTDFAIAIEKGDLNTKHEALGQKDVLGHSLIKMRERLNLVLKEVNDVAFRGGQLGQLDVRISTEDKKESWKELSEAINNLLESISSPLLVIDSIANAMAISDLSKRYEMKSEGQIQILSKNFNKGLTNLNNLLNEITKTATIINKSSIEMLQMSDEINVSVEEISTSISQMSVGVQSQSTKIDESSTIVENILAKAKDSSEKSKDINNTARSGFDRSEKGVKIMNEVVSNMTSISNFAGKTNESIDQLSNRLNEIYSVLSLISEIASKTNLLALNAAIEAARAGDAGRGFSVVADEIRKLAEGSKKSVLKIENLVKEIKSDSDIAVSAMKEMEEGVKSGEHASQKALNVFQEISNSSKKTLEASEEILRSSDDQIENVNEIVGLTEAIVVVSEQTASGSEECASSAAEISAGMQNYHKKSQHFTQIANLLKDNLQKFKLSIQS